MKFNRRRAVSPIIATLLLIAIAVAAGIIVYVYVNSLAGGLTSGGGQQVSQQLQLQASNFLPQTVVGTGGFTDNGQIVDIFLKNTGSSSLSISNVYFDGVQLTEWGLSGANYQTNLYVPATTQSCFALITTASTLTFSRSPTTSISGATAACTGTAGVVCNTAATDFCIVSSTATPAETGMTTVPLAAQGGVQLVIGLNAASSVTSGTTHTIKIVTTSGGQAVFTVTAGRTG